MSTLPVSNEQRALCHLHIGQPQSEHFAATEPTQQHGKNHGPIPMSAQCTDQSIDVTRREDLGQGLGDTNQRDRLGATATAAG